MPFTDEDVRQVLALVQPLIGCRITSVEFESDAVMGLTLDVDGSPWALWIGGSWRLEKGEGAAFIGANDDAPEAENAVRELIGTKLGAFRVVGPMGDSELVFGRGRLRIFARSSEGMPHWLVRFADRDELVFGPGTNWSRDNTIDAR